MGQNEGKNNKEEYKIKISFFFFVIFFISIVIKLINGFNFAHYFCGFLYIATNKFNLLYLLKNLIKKSNLKKCILEAYVTFITKLFNFFIVVKILFFFSSHMKAHSGLRRLYLRSYGFYYRLDIAKAGK